MGDKDASATTKGVRLTAGARTATAIAAAACVGAVWWILRYYHDPLPDFLLGVAGIGALLCTVLTIIGRLPSGFEVGGLEMSFEQDDLADLIGTVRSSLDDDTEARDRILKMISAGTGSRAFKAASGTDSASGSDDEATEGVVVTAQSETPSPATRAPEPREVIRNAIREIADDGQLREPYDVPESGRGKAPRFDFFFCRNASGVAVEYERYWNATTVDLVSRKAARALAKGTPVDRVIVVTRPEGVQKFSALESLDGRVHVVALPDFNASALRQIAEMPLS